MAEIAVLFSQIQNYLERGVYNEAFETELKIISEVTAETFNKSSKNRGEKLPWHTQLQYMLNAYLTETHALNLMTSRKYWDTISEYLVKEGYRGAPAEYFQFHNHPNDHKIYSTTLEKVYLANRECYDIFGSDSAKEDKDPYRIEVKATVESKKELADGFHEADIVLVYTLDSHKLYFRYRHLRGGYSDLITLGYEDVGAYRLSLKAGKLYKSLF